MYLRQSDRRELWSAGVPCCVLCADLRVSVRVCVFGTRLLSCAAATFSRPVRLCDYRERRNPGRGASCDAVYREVLLG